MESLTQLQHAYDTLQAEAVRLAGTKHDLAQRAATYHHIYEASGRNHVFPLIAAHGALWARSYFAFGMRLGGVLSCQYGWGARRRRQLEALEIFAEVFREVNRLVCVETYTSYHFTRRFGDHPLASRFVRAPLGDTLRAIHAAQRQGRELDDQEKRAVFETHFLDEQQHVVGPRINRAVTEFAWPLMKRLALRPIIRFAYFPKRHRLYFRHFQDRAERIRHGMRAFDLAAAVSWQHTEATLNHYEVLPKEFFTCSADHFAHLRQSVLAPA